MLLHFVLQTRPGPVQLHLNGIGFLSHDLCNLVQGLLALIKQGQDLGIIGAQHPDRVIHHIHPAFLLDLVGPHTAVYTIGYLKYAFFIQRMGGQLLFAEKRDTGGGGNRIQPGTEFGLAFKITQCPVGFDKYILCHFFRIFPAGDIPQGDGKHKVLVTLHQQGKGLLVAL